MSNPSKPLMLVLSSPSGAGKTTLSKKIQQSDNSFKISVSHTTRKARANEVDGVDYHFVTKEKFKQLLSEDAFYEHSEIFGNYYGTSKSTVLHPTISTDAPLIMPETEISSMSGGRGKAPDQMVVGSPPNATATSIRSILFSSANL